MDTNTSLEFSGRGASALDLPGHMQRHPYQTLLIAAGVGYILGGGLFTRLTLNVLRIGIRMGALPIVKRELLGAAEAAIGARMSSPFPGDSTTVQ